MLSLSQGYLGTHLSTMKWDSRTYILNPPILQSLVADQIIASHPQDTAIWYEHDTKLLSGVPKGEYVMTLRHTSLRTEGRIPTSEDFRATFTVGDETSEEMILIWPVASG